MKHTYLFKNLHLISSREARKECVVFFHGFPGRIDNGDLAAAVSAAYPVDTFVVHHEGLKKSPGEFSFLKSIENGIALVKDHIIGDLGYSKVNVFGNSWGGAVALNVAASLGSKLNKLILAAPYSVLPGPDQCKAIAIHLMNEDPSLNGRFNPDVVPADILEIKKNFDPLHAAENINAERVFLFHGLRDELIPTAATQALAKQFMKEPSYIEVDQDHDFADRKAFIQNVISCLA